MTNNFCTDKKAPAAEGNKWVIPIILFVVIVAMLFVCVTVWWVISVGNVKFSAQFTGVRAGTMEFRILASRGLTQDQDIIRLAESTPDVTDVYDGEKYVAKWVPINQNELAQFVNNPAHVVRQTGEFPEVLVLIDMYDVNGGHLKSIYQGMFPDGSGVTQRPGIAFSFNSLGTALFQELTSNPVIGALGASSVTKRYLGIIINGEMYSAPVLEEPITGGACTITFSSRPGDKDNKKLNQEIKDMLQTMR